MPHCKLSGTGPLAGNNVSHANNKTRMVQQPNMQLKRIWVPELNKNVRVRLTTRALRTVTKMGLLPFLKKNNIKLKDITRG